MKLAATSAVLLLAASAAMAATVHVPGDQPTIQAGIDVADPGDVVLVASGTYTGTGNKNLVFHDEAITLRSETGTPTDCIIDCEGSGRGFYISGPNVGLVVEGFTVTNGVASPGGGAFIFADCTLRRCVFTACFEGGADVRGTATLEECSFLGNSSFRGGGVSFIDGFPTTPTLIDCVVADNFAYNDGGGVVVAGSWVVLQGCVIAGNEASNGGGVSATTLAYTDIIGCTITGNTASFAGGAGGVYVDGDDTTANVSNCIISFSPQGQGIIDESTKGWPPSCTNVFGNAGGDWPGGSPPGSGDGDFSADPLFCGPESGDFTLSSQSPCLPGNHPDGVDCELIGALGEGCGPVGVEAETWAGIKDRYHQ